MQNIKSPVVIYGYGKEGKSTYNFLSKKYPEFKIYICDQNKIDVKNYISEKELLSLEFNTLIKAPGIPRHNKYVEKIIEKNIKVTSLTNIFFQHCNGKTIGVTGTKGKSTTSSLLSQILKTKYEDVRLVGNIGSPSLDQLETHNQETIFVIEMSSYQLEDLEQSPQIAVILEIFEEHLDYHQNFNNYKNAKLNICKSSETKIFAHSSLKKELAQKNQIEAFFDNDFKEHKKENINPANLAAASLVAKELKVEKIEKAIKDYKPLEHRLELIGKHQGIIFYNDSLATIPEATIYALNTLGNNVETLIAGGKDRGVNYQNLSKYINNSNIKNLILFPDTDTKIESEIKKEMNIFKVNKMQNAVEIAFKHTSKDKICLLSPASSSLNLFKNYKDRAEQFIHSVKNFSTH